MNKRNLTWQDLYNHIATMSEEERNSRVLIWGEECSLSNDVALCIEPEDLVYDPEDIDHVAVSRSEYDGEGEPEVALDAGITYLFK